MLPQHWKHLLYLFMNWGEDVSFMVVVNADSVVIDQLLIKHFAFDRYYA
jgi:hypothetical protein